MRLASDLDQWCFILRHVSEISYQRRARNTEEFCRPHQNGRMFSSCVCSRFKRWRKPLMYSSCSCFCWCISSNARKTSTRRFFSITRSACSNSRTTVRYRAVFIALQVFIFKCGLKCSPEGEGKVVWPSVTSLAIDNSFLAAYCTRLLYVSMAHVKHEFLAYRIISFSPRDQL